MMWFVDDFNTMFYKGMAMMWVFLLLFGGFTLFAVFAIKGFKGGINEIKIACRMLFIHEDVKDNEEG